MRWITRALWCSLPLTVGAMLTDAVDGWSRASQYTAAVLACTVLLVGLLALLLPDGRSFTALRVVAALPLLIVVATSRASQGWLVAIGALHAVTAAFTALGAPVANECAQAEAYGNELRRPLRTPPLLCIVTAIEVLAFAACLTTGPLLLAARHWSWGVVASVLGAVLAVVLVRSVHSLSKRFYVFVPAGLVISDALVLVDPVLLPSEHIVGFDSFDGQGDHDPHAAIDTRIGALVGSVRVDLDEPGTFVVRGARRTPRSTEASCLLFTPLRAREFLEMAAPPTSGSFRHDHDHAH